MEKTKKFDVKKVVKIAIFAALSIVLYQFKFSLPFFPEFLKIQFSALPLVIIGYALGPTAGIIALLIKFLICLPATKTFGVGDVADLIITGVYILTTSLIYMRNKTKKNAAVSLVIGFASWVVVAFLANYLILVPAYVWLVIPSGAEGFVAMCSIIPNISLDNYQLYYAVFAALPFNCLIAFVVSLVTFFVYKRVSKILEKYE